MKLAKRNRPRKGWYAGTILVCFLLATIPVGLAYQGYHRDLPDRTI